ncbi:MAG: peptidase M22, partial [Ruminococcus bromii]|nr:peptidase M22 [Ruminococcus bromii]
MLDFCTLGIDTSNYTTSAALLENGVVDSRGKLLPVKAGEIGLRQSDAVFHHTRQLPEVMAALGGRIGGARAVGVSNRPRDKEDSYMPCFLVG